MSNTLSTLSQRLAVALRDETYTTWDSEEMDNLITWSVAGLYPRISRELPYATNTVTLVAGTYLYNAPAGMLNVQRIDWVNTDGDEMGPLNIGAWESRGDFLGGSGTIHISPAIADSGGTLRVQGYGRYDVATNPVPDDYVPLVLAKARAEAYRRIAASRVRYQQWSASEQLQDTSVSELMTLINEADVEYERMRRQMRTWQRPVSARRG